jgi:hypothetical protein
LEEKSKVLLFGLGCYGEDILKELTKNWETIAVDIKEEKIKKAQENKIQAEFIVGDASSILTWKKFNINEIKYIITTITDADVDLEICRIAREVFKLDIPIIVLLHKTEREKEFQPYNVNIVKPVEITKHIVLNIIEKNYIKAINIGLGKGEIIEVTILAKSHLVDRKLKYLKPSKWRIAAIYRGEKLIIPSGDTQIKVGDKVILIGDPKVLENLVNILLKGIPQFPLQFGTNIVSPISKRFKKTVQETLYFFKHTKVQKIIFFPYKSRVPKDLKNEIENEIKNVEYGKKISSLKELAKLNEDTGLIALPYSDLSFFEKMKLKYFFKNSSKPFLIERKKFPYKGIVVSLNNPDPAYALEIGIELSRMFNIPYRVIYVALPKQLRTESEEKQIQEIQEIISDFEGIYKKSINYIFMEGNPIKESLKYLKEMENNLLILAFNKRESISLFNPNVSYLIAKKTNLSTLVLPLEESYGT